MLEKLNILYDKEKAECLQQIICVTLKRFLGTEILDHVDLEMPLSIVLDPILMFIRRHTSTAAKITATVRIDIPEYPPDLLSEAIMKALPPTTYPINSSSISITIFDDRIEIDSSFKTTIYSAHRKKRSRRP